MKDIKQLISTFENGSPIPSIPPRKPPRIKTLTSYKMPRSDSGLQLEATTLVDRIIQPMIPSQNHMSNYKNVSVKKLREIWENVASSNNWMTDVNTIKLSEVSSKAVSGCHKNSSSDHVNKCDMIVCGIKTVIINQVKMHQIELGCHHCDSRFLMTAAHECDKDDNTTDLVVQHGKI